jgi:hypothetical protein
MPRLANPEDQGRRRREQNRDNQRRQRRKARQDALALQRGQPEERLNSEPVSEEPPIVREEAKKRKRDEDETAEKETLKQRLQIAEERVRELEEVLLTIWPELRQKHNDAIINQEATEIKRKATE